MEHKIAIETPRAGRLDSTRCLRAPSRIVRSRPQPRIPVLLALFFGLDRRAQATVHEHKDMIYTSEHYAVGTLGLTENDIIFSAPKLFFAYGLGNSLSFPLWTGCTAILLEDRPTAENTLDMSGGSGQPSISACRRSMPRRSPSWRAAARSR